MIDKQNMAGRVLLTMPDGMMMCIWIPKGKGISECVHPFIDHWFKVTCEKPEKCGHIVLEDKCPKCGKPMHANKRKPQWRWCPYCRYQENEENHPCWPY